MATNRPDPALIEALIAAMTHPVRGRILAAATDKPGLGAKDVSRRTGVPVGRVRYHLRVLVKAGLIAVEEEAARRGVVEHRYRVDAIPELGSEFEAYLSDQVKQKLAFEVLKIIFADATLSIESGVMWRRRDRWLVRIWGEVDGHGWKELSEIHEKVLEETRRVIGESAERLRSGQEEPIPVTSASLMFEAPIWAPPQD